MIETFATEELHAPTNRISTGFYALIIPKILQTNIKLDICYCLYLCLEDIRSIPSQKQQTTTAIMWTTSLSSFRHNDIDRNIGILFSFFSNNSETFKRMFECVFFFGHLEIQFKCHPSIISRYIKRITYIFCVRVVLECCVTDRLKVYKDLSTTSELRTLFQVTLMKSRPTFIPL